MKKNSENGKRRGFLDRLLSLPTWVWVTLIALLAVVDMVRRYAFGGVCLMRELTNVPCPACGMSRALLSLLRLDIAAAFEYHPVFWVFPIACLSAVLCAFDGKRRKAWAICFAVCTAIFLGCWVIRIATGTAV